VNAEVRVVSGAKAGLVSRLSRGGTVIGRHPDSGLQLHPTLDLEVSARHAEIVCNGGRWFIRDLDSRNGTYVNGLRVTGETLLWDGDRVMLGMTGPALEFVLPDLAVSATRVIPAAAPGLGAAVPVAAGSRTEPERLGDADRFRSAVRQNRRLRWLTGAMAVLLLAIVGAYRIAERDRNASWESERLGMQSRIDSLLVASEASAAALEGMLGGLTAALRQSQEEIRTISEQLRRAEAAGDRSQVSSLRTRLETATVALDRQQTVAGLDFRGIERRNRRAVAKVFVEFDDGEVATGTAFAVRPDATLLTSRHLVMGANRQRRLSRMAVQFADSDQVWPARVVLVANDADLAMIKVDNIVGVVPTVQALNLRSDTLPTGAPVALIGYPLGGATERPNGSALEVARPLLSAGVLSARREDRFEVRGYGAAGASGSPIFDANGEVVAVLFGGRRDASGNQTLISVPSGAAARLLERAQ
jgi:S1-C subfamily serine protease